jgi:hypothetical protein
VESEKRCVLGEWSATLKLAGIAEAICGSTYQFLPDRGQNRKLSARRIDEELGVGDEV